MPSAEWNRTECLTFCQLINKTYVITIQEQDSANDDYYFQNLINLIEYPFAINSFIPSEASSTVLRKTGFPSSAHSFSRSNLNSLHQTVGNSDAKNLTQQTQEMVGFTNDSKEKLSRKKNLITLSVAVSRSAKVKGFR